MEKQQYKYKYRYGGVLFGKEERAAINRVLDRNFWQIEREGDLMEKECSEYLGVKHGLLANSGSSAALLALSALELPKGSEIIIPAVTFPTIFNIILQCGLVPVVIDAKIGTYCSDVKDVEKAINKKTRAVIVVHLLGNVVDMPLLMRKIDTINLRRKIKDKIYVLEDFCDAFGSKIKGREIGSFGDVNFTSFHAAHIIAMGQGGGAFTNDKELAEKMRMYRDWGRQANLEMKENTRFPKLPKDQNPRYIYEKIGYNLSPLELQAAMGRVQLRKVEKIKRLRKRNFDYLYKELSKFDDLIMPNWIKGADICWFGFPVSVKNRRPELIKWLDKKGIETRTMMAGNVIKHPAFENSVYRINGKLKDADWILEHSLWFTVHPRYTPKDLSYIIKAFQEFYEK